jgi:hypothetical protein
VRRSALIDSLTEYEPVPRMAGRAGWRFASAAGWAAVGVAVAIAAASAGVALADQLPTNRWSRLPLQGGVAETAAVTAGLVAIYGLLIGGLAGLVVGGPRRVAGALRHGLGWAGVGAMAGGLGPVLGSLAGGRMSMATATIVACGIAGLLAALVGYGCRRQPTEAHEDLGDHWPAVSAVKWAAAGVAVAAAACAIGVALGQQFLPVPWPDRELTGSVAGNISLMAGLGAAYGLFAGGAAGLVLADRQRLIAALRHGMGFAIVGAVAGGLGPVLEAVSGGRLPASVATTIACGIAGLLAGLVGYAMRQRAQEPTRELDDWLADAEATDRSPPPAVGRAPDAGPVIRQWPILAISVACLAVIVVGPASAAGWPLLAVALLGFAVAWALAVQDQRLGALEDQLRKRAAGTEPNGRGDR